MSTKIISHFTYKVTNYVTKTSTYSKVAFGYNASVAVNAMIERKEYLNMNPVKQQEFIEEMYDDVNEYRNLNDEEKNSITDKVNLVAKYGSPTVAVASLFFPSILFPIHAMCDGYDFYKKSKKST